MREYRKLSKGFTLVEILVVVAVAGVLLGLVCSVGASAIQQASAARETSAARTLVSAYASAAADNDGMLLRGYDDSADAMSLPRSGAVSAAAAHRYPYRLAPYFNDMIDGVILVNKNKGQIARMGGNRTYFCSLFPALGMNATFVGGVYQTGEMEFKNEKQDEVATRMVQVTKPSSLLVFASAGHGKGKEKVDGYYRLEPPAKKVDVWSSGSPTEDSSPDNFGQVDFRYNKRAVCAFLDGSVRMMNVDELRDMRYWSKNAQLSDNPVYRVTVVGPPPGRGSGR